jgi:hypothetical protein
METLRYGKGKLLGTMVAAGLGAAVSMVLLLYPENVAHVRRLRVFASDFGHYFLAPALVLLCTIVVWRGALILVGDRKAVESTPDHLVLTSWWRTRRAAWRDIGHIAVSAVGGRGAWGHQLVVHYRSAGLFGSATVKLSLGTTELNPSRYQDFVDALAALQAQRGGGAASDAAEPIEPGGFDADAALARYLAKKASTATDAQLPAARPAFGRRVI